MKKYWHYCNALKCEPKSEKEQCLEIDQDTPQEKDSLRQYLGEISTTYLTEIILQDSDLIHKLKVATEEAEKENGYVEV